MGTGQGLQCLGRWEGPTVRDHLCGMEEAAENITEPGQSRRGGKWQSSVILDEAPGNCPKQLRGHSKASLGPAVSGGSTSFPCCIRDSKLYNDLCSTST